MRVGIFYDAMAGGPFMFFCGVKTTEPALTVLEGTFAWAILRIWVKGHCQEAS